MPASRSPAGAVPLLPPEIAPPPLAEALLRLHRALTLRELWPALRGVAHEAIAHRALTFEIGVRADGTPKKTYRHAQPGATPEVPDTRPVREWLALHPGVRVCRFSDVVGPRDRAARRGNRDRLLGIAAWRGREMQGALNFFRETAAADFSPPEVRLAEALQPHFETAVARVLAHEAAGFRAGQFAAMLEDVPVGLLLLDWELRPLWLNGEAAHGCAVWNHGERRAAALRPRQLFRVPAPLAGACAELRAKWERRATTGAPELGPIVVSEHALGLHAQIVLRAVGASALLPPTFQIQLDYRRPRGDRHRPLSPGAVALLARLSAREREVAMRVREGLRTAEIAAELKRSPLTIKTQIAAIFAKLGVASRTRVAALLNR
ncbi:MAG: helix-turn-helix transcriptional regulator [Verrucomicrobia bacterium]|nr:helix-turn-helix transcriptional regulator [Verrucomicrobiota bacterium]